MYQRIIFSSVRQFFGVHVLQDTKGADFALLLLYCTYICLAKYFLKLCCFMGFLLKKNNVIFIEVLMICEFNSRFYQANLQGCRESTPPLPPPQCCATGGVEVALFQPIAVMIRVNLYHPD
jgi:hypothetical protein